VALLAAMALAVRALIPERARAVGGPAPVAGRAPSSQAGIRTPGA
jgi:hypothetical protein